MSVPMKKCPWCNTAFVPKTTHSVYCKPSCRVNSWRYWKRRLKQDMNVRFTITEAVEEGK